MTRDDVIREAQQLSDDFYQRGTVHVLLPFMENDWKTGKLTNVGEPVSLFNPTEYNVDEPPYFNTFLLYLIPTDVVVKAGGCNGKENDCLWEAMMLICPKTTRSVFSTPESLKEAIGLDRTDLVPLDKIHEIESRLPSRFKIIKKRDYKVHGVASKEKKPIVYQYLDDGTVKLFNGIEYSNCTKTEFEVNRRNTITCVQIHISNCLVD
ncbi:hypothetical protein DFA_10489 [Cavenderia fasciculata]|uniref:Uncharacterized protein n=1 Tax=Cavenderia fasciculata TaxID=261658 RepID=F4QAC8_CACFS|nr:uncharacterized protein DFA_10489 [Cavenderia fasciculata]EGG15647.1 hypothetical protein DFA_10489 [Cavenderia fasciculata]|eukprot:XP_004354389.1 hypothetical protein DFA_10489 [Cavenderia fasciculata]